MKVALIHYRLIHRGGLERRFINYINWFSRNNHEVHIFTIKKDDDVVLPKGVHLHLLKLRWIPKSYRSYFFQKKIRRILPSYGFDFVLSTGRTGPQDAAIVAGTHLGFLSRMKKRNHGISDRLQISLDKLTYRESRILFPSSAIVKEEMEKYYDVDSSRIHVLYPPIDTNRFNHSLKANKNQYRKDFCMEEDKRVFVLVSSNHALKGLPLLEKIFASLPAEFELWVAGPSFYPKSKNVKSLGFVKETEKLFAAADCSLLPTAYDTFAQVIAESVLCGTPVIVSKYAGAVEIIKPQTGLVIQNLEEEAWKEAILKFRSEAFEMEKGGNELMSLSLDQHMNKMMLDSGLK